MIKVPNKLVIFGAVAAAALAVPGVLSPLMFEEAYAHHRDVHQETGQQRAVGVVALNAAVNANDVVDINRNDVTACVLVDQCTPDQSD
jgi:hypothetical protein